ncbi:MAG: PilZ domain-containing protein [Pseudobutyrivibrio sp.]|nr:PilZ domain-containing protein [Pseudobutyrivibrio sp.]
MGNTNKQTMDINSIPIDATVYIVANLGNKTAELQSKMSSLNEEEKEELTKMYGDTAICIEPIVRGEGDNVKEVSFSGHVSKLELLASTTNGMFKWSPVAVNNQKLSSGKVVNVVKPKFTEGKYINRRRGVRVNLDKAMIVEQNGEKYNVVVKDISYCGVGFVEPKEGKLDPNEPFVLHLMETTKDNENIVLGKFGGKILYQKSLESGGVFSGCVLGSQHADYLQKYVATKQLEIISGKSRMAPLQKSVEGENWKENITEALESSFKNE